MMRIQYHRYGGPGEMRLEDYQLPPLQASQVQVRVRAASVNPFDWKVRSGVMKFMTGRVFPRAMGSDFAGVVEQVGAAVTRLRPGDEVLGTARIKESGAFAPVLVTDEKLVVRKPTSLSFEQAACLPIAAVTAWRGLFDKARIEAGQRVFINGCTGNVGQAAVQIARLAGASVAGSCSRANAPYARRLGVDPVFDYAGAGLSGVQDKFDVVFDTAGTLSIPAGLALLAPGGVLLDINTTLPKAVRGLFSSRYRMVFGSQTVETLEQVAKLAADGKLQFQIGCTVPLAQAIQGITEVENGRKPPGRAVILMT
jgi:NADPH:quinone reductase-like Zn-dependent oxidoreductase